MNRQVFVRLLLSLVLLLSQQMATSHALEHLTGALTTASMRSVDAAATDEASELAKAVAQHQNCHQCLAFAQLAAPLGSSALNFALHGAVAHGAVQPTLALHRIDTAWARQARAPPLA